MSLEILTQPCVAGMATWPRAVEKACKRTLALTIRRVISDFGAVICAESHIALNTRERSHISHIRA